VSYGWRASPRRRGDGVRPLIVDCSRGK